MCGMYVWYVCVVCMCLPVCVLCAYVCTIMCLNTWVCEDVSMYLRMYVCMCISTPYVLYVHVYVCVSVWMYVCNVRVCVDVFCVYLCVCMDACL
jgi:hypothetical protein